MRLRTQNPLSPFATDMIESGITSAVVGLSGGIVHATISRGPYGRSMATGALIGGLTGMVATAILHGLRKTGVFE